MIVGLDGREACQVRPGGLRTYAESVISCLSGRRDALDLTVYLERGLPSDSDLPRDVNYQVCSPAQLALREQFFLPRRLRQDGIQIAHFPANTAPLRCPVPYVLTLHDTFCMERSVFDIIGEGSLHNKALSLYSKIVFFCAGRRARRVVTVSSWSRQQIADRLKLSAEHIAVIPQAMHPRYRPVNAADTREAIKRAAGATQMVLMFGPIEPRKNLPRMLAAFEMAASRSGSLGLALTWPAGVDLREWLARQGMRLPPRVCVLYNVSNDDLVRLYCAVELFVFASHKEGFGLPVIEAMACGCPVITSTSSSLPETAGGAALLANTDDADDIAEKMLLLSGDAGLRDRLRESGFGRSAEFSAERAANSLLEVYRTCL
jgi:glycosyltransferase involved in cell wall biosynthesis